ncbi:hypothetical protein O3W44_22840 [Pantoea sp. LMR881]|uniref:hypothetical protein n=1 Tax=Pantoea sp. LMR881 TaxID=3014336 RepID=UPI0022AE710B|nr:hypothetical protein [Pantoea sp. LMR881]MCZ4061370.1 hypothetical protein [Pantoea sp. LMR881]
MIGVQEKELYDLSEGVREKVVSLNDWNKTAQSRKKLTVSGDPIRFPDMAGCGWHEVTKSLSGE